MGEKSSPGMMTIGEKSPLSLNYHPAHGKTKCSSIVVMGIVADSSISCASKRV